MSDGKIEQVPDKKGSHERVTGHVTSADTGRTVVPSAVGTTRGAQLGRDHSVAAPSTMVMPDGNRVPVVPPAPSRAAQPYEVPAPPVPAAHAPAPVAALMAEEEGTPALAPAAPAAREDRISTAEFQAPPPSVSVTLKSLPKDPVIRWRARYHEILVTPNTVVLVWDSRFRHADSPLLPIDNGDLVKLKMIVQPTSKADLPFSLDVADCGLSFVHGPFEYFVFVRDTNPQPEDAPAVPTPPPDLM